MLPEGDTPSKELSISDFELESDPTPALVEERERKFGRYRLKYQIASGGMASVFLAGAAGAAGFEKPVAIKRMHPHLARRKAYVDMFLDEAKITSRINHPNVCQVFDFGEMDGAYYMAMEYLVGEPLSTVLAYVQKAKLQSSPKWLAIAARIMASVCEGLHASHELRDSSGQTLEVVHRDVSPSNIIVSFDGGVKVVDFGVAKARGRIHQTTTGTLKGKFSYMAPEQVRGQPIDRRADVWSVGVCLWEMLTCKRLFKRGSEMETLLAVGQGDIPSPSALNPVVPPSLSAIALHALERDVNNRYATTREVSRALEAWLRSQEQPAGMADIADFLASTLTREHASKVLFVQTAMRERSDDMMVAAAQTRVLGGGPATAVSNTPPAFSESKSHTRPIAGPEEVTSSKSTTTGGGPNVVALSAAATVLLAALVAAVIGVVYAFTNEDDTTPTATPLVDPPVPVTPDEPESEPEEVQPPEVEQETGLSDAERAELIRLREEAERLRQEREEAERLRREEEARQAQQAQQVRNTRSMRSPMTGPPGSLFLFGLAGARIQIDGRPRGVTPKMIEGLSPGRHSVVLQKDGQTREFGATISSGEVTRRRITF